MKTMNKMKLKKKVASKKSKNNKNDLQIRVALTGKKSFFSLLRKRLLKGGNFQRFLCNI